MNLFFTNIFWMLLHKSFRILFCVAIRWSAFFTLFVGMDFNTENNSAVTAILTFFSDVSWCVLYFQVSNISWHWCPASCLLLPEICILAESNSFSLARLLQSFEMPFYIAIVTFKQLHGFQERFHHNVSCRVWRWNVRTEKPRESQPHEFQRICGFNVIEELLQVCNKSWRCRIKPLFSEVLI